MARTAQQEEEPTVRCTPNIVEQLPNQKAVAGRLSRVSASSVGLGGSVWVSLQQTVVAINVGFMFTKAYLGARWLYAAGNGDECGREGIIGLRGLKLAIVDYYDA